MKVISLTQPWATLIALGAKKIETRSWGTRYRGPLAIHAAQGLGPVGGVSGLIDTCSEEPFLSVLKAAGVIKGGIRKDRLHRGAIIAVCTLLDVRRMPGNIANLALWGNTSADGSINVEWPLTDQERAFGDYTPGRYAWLLADIRPLPEPIPCAGKLGLWTYEGTL